MEEGFMAFQSWAITLNFLPSSPCTRACACAYARVCAGVRVNGGVKGIMGSVRSVICVSPVPTGWVSRSHGDTARGDGRHTALDL